MSKASKSDLDASSLNGGDNISLDPGADQSKYEKLAQDYVKLRSKLTVLKKAYIELSDSSSQKDQTIRKFEQELEGLSFRNQQLTARVEALQRDLDDKNSQNSINVSNTSLNSSLSISTKPPNDILAEELQHKINENQSLHRKLSDLEVDLRQKIAKNEEALKKVEFEKIMLEKKLEALQSSSKVTIEKLENDKIKLELTIIQLENQLRSTHMEKEIKESELLKKENEHNLLVKQHAEISKNSSSSSLNIKKESEILGLFKSSIESLIRIYPCLEEKFKNQITKQVAKCEQILKSIEVKFTDLNFKEIDNLIQEYFDSNHKMLNLIMNDLIQTSNNDEIDKLRKKIKIYVNKLDQFIFGDGESFSIVLQNLFSCFKNSKSILSNDVIMSGLRNFIDILEKLLFAMNEKLSLEYSLDYSSEVTTIDECLVSYISQFKQSICQFIPFNIVDSVIKLRNELNEDVRSEKSFLNDEEIEKLKQNLTEKEIIIKNLEDKFEYLKSKSTKDDFDLKDLRVKIESLQLKLLNLEEKDKLNEKVISNYKNEIERVEQRVEQREIVEQKLETIIVHQKLDVEKEENLEDLDKKLEKPTAELYEIQLETLNKRIQFLDSKAYYYYDEMKCLLERLKLQIDINNSQSHDLNEIKDQLDRTRSSYEMQMSTMSDHLIEMTDRMTKQGEENDKLKHQLETLNSVKSSKTKNKK